MLTGQAKQEREWTVRFDSTEVASVLEKKDFTGLRRRKLHGSGLKRGWKGRGDIGYWIFLSTFARKRNEK